MQNVTNPVSLPLFYCRHDIHLLLDLWYTSFLAQSVKVVSNLLQHCTANLPRISDLLFEVSTFQHHTKLRSQYVALDWFLPYN